MSCPITGTATVTQHLSTDGSFRVEWVQADPEIHIDPELLDDEGAYYQIGLVYEIDALDSCPYGLGIHARRREDKP